MTFNNAVADCQTKSRSGWFCGPERLKQMACGVLGYPGTGVGNTDNMCSHEQHHLTYKALITDGKQISPLLLLII